MALTTDQLTSITQNKIIPKMYDNIFDSTPLLSKIMASGSYKAQNGGTQIEIPLNYAAGTGGWYSGADTLSTDDVENITNAIYSWKSCYSAITITKEDELKNSGNMAVLSLLASKSEIAKKTIKDKIATGLYNAGTDAKAIVGLRDIVAQDQVVGGIDQSSYSWWQAQISTDTTLTLSGMNSLFQDCSLDGEQPGLIVGTKANYNRYYNLLQPQQRFVNTSSSTAKGGFQSLLFNGSAFLSDTYCPSGYIFMLNLSHLHLFYHPERNISLKPFAEPINQELKTARVLWMGAVGSSNNRMHGAMTSVAA